MTICLALLRGINVGGHKQVAMADLRDLLTHLGCRDGQSVLQSGNLVFRCNMRRGGEGKLERLLEAAAAKRLGLQADFLVRTARDWQAVIARNPFHAEAKRDPGHLIVMALKAAPPGPAVRALQAAITGPEVVRAVGKQAYIVFPNGIGRSRLTNAVIEAKLGTRATGRNWNTVLRLAALADTYS